MKLMEKYVNKDIYKMKLHETINLDEEMIRKVPGGWIYNSYLFVPYSNEFFPKKDEKCIDCDFESMTKAGDTGAIAVCKRCKDGRTNENNPFKKW